jgi:hypothetical protein
MRTHLTSSHRTYLDDNPLINWLDISYHFSYFWQDRIAIMVGTATSARKGQVKNLKDATTENVVVIIPSLCRASLVAVPPFLQ